MKFWRQPLDVDRLKVPRGTVHIIVERCKGCAFCVEYCPKDVIEISKKFNKKGYHYPEVKKDGVCVDCNLCEAICPEFAIFSTPVEAQAAEGEQAKAAENGEAKKEQRAS